MNKHELALKIKTLEGLSNDDKSDLLQLLHEQKKYGLVWEDKPENVEERLREELPVLKEVKERAIISEDKDAPNHILIEGDNLEALTALTYTHAGKIDVIYIDPPYNRGERDFKYNDDYIAKDNPFRHSLWLCFMRKRLDIAKTLLSDKGVLIVHIDEHEFDALNLLLENDIFSRNNCLGQIIWNKLNPKGDSNAVAVQHEYILIYCKNKDNFNQTTSHLMREKPNALTIISKAKSLFSKIGKTLIPDDIKAVIAPFGYSEEVLKDFYVKYDLQLVNKEFDAWLSRSSFSQGEKAYKYIDENGDAFQPVSMAWPNKKIPNAEYFIPLKHPINGQECPVPDKGWRYPPSTFETMLGTHEPIIVMPEMVIKGQIVFTTGKNGNNQPRNKYLLKNNLMENTPSIVNDGSSDDNLFKDLRIQFEYPKTIVISKYLLKNILPDAKTILDFFAGSGTTLHATMALNAEDEGHRQCILVTNNENNICEEVTYIRNKKVIEGYTTPKGEEVAGLKKNNLRYYKTDFISRKRTIKNMRALVSVSTDLLCIKNNVYKELSTFGARKLKPEAARYFDDGQTKMLIIYNEQGVDTFASMLRTMDVEGKIKIYVFSNNRYAYNDNFQEVIEKVELCALPAAIYDAYNAVLKPIKNDDDSGDVIMDDNESEEVYEQRLLNFSEEGGEQ